MLPSNIAGSAVPAARSEQKQGPGVPEAPFGLGRTVFAAGEGPYGPFEFAEGHWEWEFLAWNTGGSTTAEASLRGKDFTTRLMRYSDGKSAVSFGRGTGRFYLGPTDALLKHRAGMKYVVVGSYGGWLLTLTRDG